MPRLSSQCHFATLKDVNRLWKRIGGNRRPFSWFLRPRGLPHRLHQNLVKSLFKGVGAGGVMRVASPNPLLAHL